MLELEVCLQVAWQDFSEVLECQVCQEQVLPELDPLELVQQALLQVPQHRQRQMKS